MAGHGARVSASPLAHRVRPAAAPASRVAAGAGVVLLVRALAKYRLTLVRLYRSAPGKLARCVRRVALCGAFYWLGVILPHCVQKPLKAHCSASGSMGTKK